MDLKLQRQGMRTSSENRKVLDRQHHHYLLLFLVLAATLTYTHDNKDTMSDLLATELNMTRETSDDTFRGKRAPRDLEEKREESCTR
jgi:hypothetical protein